MVIKNILVLDQPETIYTGCYQVRGPQHQHPSGQQAAGKALHHPINHGFIKIDKYIPAENQVHAIGLGQHRGIFIIRQIQIGEASHVTQMIVDRETVVLTIEVSIPDSIRCSSE